MAPKGPARPKEQASSSGDVPNSIREIGTSDFSKVLVYAMPGVGKTILVGSSGPRGLIIRPPTDHTDSIVSFYPREVRPREWVSHDWDEMDSVYQYLRLHGQDWEWVWLDSISLWQDTGLDDIWQAVIDRKPERNAKHAGRDKGEYGRNMDRLAEWVRNVVSIDTFNFGITAFPTLRLESPSGDKKLMPWVQGSMMSEKVCGYMNMVGYMEKKISPSSGRAYRMITFEETEEFYAKDQFVCWPNYRLTDPTVPKIQAAVEAAKARGVVTTGGGKKKGA